MKSSQGPRSHSEQKLLVHKKTSNQKSVWWCLCGYSSNNRIANDLIESNMFPVSDYLFPLYCFPKKLHHVFALTVCCLEAFGPGYEDTLQRHDTSSEIPNIKINGLYRSAVKKPEDFRASFWLSSQLLWPWSEKGHVNLNKKIFRGNIPRPGLSDGRGRRRWNQVAVVRFSFPCSPGSQRCSGQCGQRAAKRRLLFVYQGVKLSIGVCFMVTQKHLCLQTNPNPICTHSCRSGFE